MRRLTMLTVAFLLCASLAQAVIANFEQNVNTQGLDQAVVAAMAEGHSLDEIMSQALAIQGMNPQAVIISMLNAGANIGAVAAAASSHGVSAQVIAQATQQQAAKGPGDTQAYTPAGQTPAAQPGLGAVGRSFAAWASIPVAGVPGGGGGSAPAERYASPSLLP